MKDLVICRNTEKNKFYLGLQNLRYETKPSVKTRKEYALYFFHSFETIPQIYKKNQIFSHNVCGVYRTECLMTSFMMFLSSVSYSSLNNLFLT